MKYNLKHVNILMGMLKYNPNLDAKNIRPLSTECVKSYFNIDSKFINNFRMRVALHNSLPHNKNIDITVQETNSLIFQSEILQDELLDFDYPMVCTNFISISRKVIHETSGVWKAIAYLKQMMLTIPGTDCRIQYDEEDFPDVITWMTPLMNNLVRYSETIFLMHK